jgi:hypothetical protein
VGTRVDYTREQADAMYALMARAWSKHWDTCEQCISASTCRTWLSEHGYVQVTRTGMREIDGKWSKE